MSIRRILMTADSVGGVWQYALDLAQALADDHEVVIAHLGPVGERRAVPAGVRVIDTGLPLDWLVDDPAAVREAADVVGRLVHDVRADVIQLNSPALAGAGRFGCPVIAVDHGCVATWWEAVRPGEPLPDRFAWHAAMVGEGLRAADLVVTPTVAYGEAVRRRYRLPFAPVTVHNGRATAARGGAAPARSALTAGRLWDAAKATPLLDAVAGRLTVPFEAAGPVVAPHGEAVVLRHLKHLGVLGEAALAEKLAARPVFVSAARFEPFGLAVLEAAAAGCPLVLADIPTFRELWDGAAVFVAGDDPEAYAAAITRLADDCERAARLGEAAAARAARYTPAAMAEAMRGVYARASAGVEAAA